MYEINKTSDIKSKIALGKMKNEKPTDVNKDLCYVEATLELSTRVKSEEEEKFKRITNT